MWKKTSWYSELYDIHHFSLPFYFSIQDSWCYNGKIIKQNYIKNIYHV